MDTDLKKTLVRTVTALVPIRVHLRKSAANAFTYTFVIGLSKSTQQ